MRETLIITDLRQKFVAMEESKLKERKLPTFIGTTEEKISWFHYLGKSNIVKAKFITGLGSCVKT